MASMEITYLYEKWKLGEEGMKQFQPTTPSGAGMGDLIARFKLRLLSEKAESWWPTVTTEVSVKTASGGFEDRRFTDSTGYSFDVLMAKDILIATGILKKIRVMTEAGFMAWDDGAHSQNDAYRYGVATQLEFKRNWNVIAGFHGYNGWEKNFDRPMTIYFEGEKVLTRRIKAFTSADFGIRDINPYTFSGGIRVIAPWKPTKGTGTWPKN
jgi:hypothetical protein